MKKIISITVAALALAGLLCGCGMSDAEPGDYSKDGFIGFSSGDMPIKTDTPDTSANKNGTASRIQRGTGTTGGLMTRQNGSDAVRNDLGVGAKTES